MSLLPPPRGAVNSLITDTAAPPASAGWQHGRFSANTGQRDFLLLLTPQRNSVPEGHTEVFVGDYEVSALAAFGPDGPDEPPYGASSEYFCPQPLPGLPTPPLLPNPAQPTFTTHSPPPSCTSPSPGLYHAALAHFSALSKPGTSSLSLGDMHPGPF